MICLRRSVALALVATYAYACSGDDNKTTPPADAGSDSSIHPVDANMPPPVDANRPVDANTPPDANPPVDANVPVDAGVDAPLVCDGGPTTRMVTVGAGGGIVFGPTDLRVCAGDTVTWTWAASGHSVTSGPGCTADSKFCSPNDTNCAAGTTSVSGTMYSHTFTDGGTFPYFCSPHCLSGMTGSIIVQ